MTEPGSHHRFAGQLGVVTGGAGGIGAGTARALAAQGMSVVLVDVDAHGAAAVAEAITADFGVDATVRAVDVVDTSAVAELAEEIDATMGPLRVVFNNAGVMPMGPILDNSVDDWRWLFDVNVIGVVNVINAFVPRMLGHGLPAHIMNTASMAAFAPSGAFPSYAASKQAVLGLTESLRDELDGTNVRVSVVCPGAVNTAIGQSERNRPSRYGPPSGRPIPSGPEQEKASLQMIEPDEAGRQIVQGLIDDEFWIFTHPAWARRIRSRFDDAYEAAQRTLERTNPPADTSPWRPLVSEFEGRGPNGPAEGKQSR